MAISNPAKVIVAIGKAAEVMHNKPNIELFRPFSHPRVAVSDYLVASKILQHAARSLIKSLPFLQQLVPSIKLIVHPERHFQGGLTDVEERTFLELGHSMGARIVKLHLGSALTQQQVGSYVFGRG